MGGNEFALMLAAGRKRKVMQLGRQILKQLSGIRKEIRNLERATGHVKKRTELHRDLQKKKSLMEKKRTELLQLENEAEEYIRSIDDNNLKRIIRFKYLYDLSWQQVAARMGHKPQGVTARHYVSAEKISKIFREYVEAI